MQRILCSAVRKAIEEHNANVVHPLWIMNFEPRRFRPFQKESLTSKVIPETCSRDSSGLTSNVLSLVLVNGVVDVHPVLGGGDGNHAAGGDGRVLQAVSRPMQRILGGAIRQAFAQFSAEDPLWNISFKPRRFRPFQKDSLTIKVIP